MRKFGAKTNNSIMVAPVKLLLAMLFGAILTLIVVFIVMFTRSIRQYREDNKLR